MNQLSRLDPGATEEAYKDADIDSPLDESAALRSADRYFHAWIKHVNESAVFGRERIDPAKSTSYGFIWRSWCRFLATRQLGEGARPEQARPMAANPIDVAQFLLFGPKGSSPNRSVSEVTRRRYFTVLQRIYAFCAGQGWITSSPVEDVAHQDRPTQEKQQGFIMSTAQWDASKKRIPIVASSAKEARDAAILRVLFDLGLRPEEIRRLRVQDFQLGIADLPTLTISASTGPGQERCMPLQERTAQSIIAWLQHRRSMPVVAGHTAQLQADLTNDALRTAGATLFVSTQKMELSMYNLLALVRSHIEEACRLSELDTPPRVGPQIIRNTRLVRWMNAGEDIKRVVMMAGLKNAKGLVHLAHACSDDVRQCLLPANRRDDATPESNVRIND